MAIAEEYSSLKTQSLGEFPFTPQTLYWRVYMICENNLKISAGIKPQYKANISRFFSILWRFYFEYPALCTEDSHFTYPFDSHTVSKTHMISLNNMISGELVDMINRQEAMDPHHRLINVMRLAGIALKLKKLLSQGSSPLTAPEHSFNDNQLIAPKTIKGPIHG